jgi:hypothetical protein
MSNPGMHGLRHEIDGENIRLVGESVTTKIRGKAVYALRKNPRLAQELVEAISKGALEKPFYPTNLEFSSRGRSIKTIELTKRADGWLLSILERHPTSPTTLIHFPIQSEQDRAAMIALFEWIHTKIEK